MIWSDSDSKLHGPCFGSRIVVCLMRMGRLLANEMIGKGLGCVALFVMMGGRETARPFLRPSLN